MSLDTPPPLLGGRGWWPRLSDAPAPDFLQPRRRPAAAWLLLAGGALAVASTTWDATLTLRDTEAAEAERQSWQARAERRRPVKAPAAVLPSADDAAAAAALASVARALQHPWPAVLGAVEAASMPGVQWTLVQHRASQALVRVEAEVADAAQGVSVVDSLASQPGWAQVVLTELAPPEGGGGSTGLRLTATAAFEPGRAVTATRP